jgi:hypothetical protein
MKGCEGGTPAQEAGARPRATKLRKRPQKSPASGRGTRRHLDGPQYRAFLRSSGLPNTCSQTASETIGERPWIMAGTVAVFIMLGAGLTGVLVSARKAVTRARYVARNGAGGSAALSIREALISTMIGSELLGAVISQVRCFHVCRRHASAAEVCAWTP